MNTFELKNNCILQVIREMAWSGELKNKDVIMYVNELSKIYDSKLTHTYNANDLINDIKHMPNFKHFFISGTPLPHPLQNMFKKKRIIGDGNCLFRCFRYLNVWNDLTHAEIRAKICSYLPEFFKILKKTPTASENEWFLITDILDVIPEDPKGPIIEDPNDSKNEDEHIKLMRSGEWGTLIEILAAILITRQYINLYYTNRSPSDKDKPGQQHSNFIIWREQLLFHNNITIDPELPILNIFNLDNWHYEILMPIEFNKDKLTEEPRFIQDILLHTIAYLNGSVEILQSPIELPASTAKIYPPTYICIPNTKGKFDTLKKCMADSTPVKQIMLTSKYSNISKAEQSSKNEDIIKHYELLVEKPTLLYEYKYMKYKIKYLTLKNNTHYNKYL